MKDLKKTYLSFFSKIALAFLVYSICRILFYFFNASLLGPFQFMAFVGGIQFDLMAISFLYAPFILSYLFLFHRSPKTLRYLFYFSSFLSILLNCIDIAYFPFTLKRTTSDFFITEGIAEDIWSLLPSYFIDYWYIALLIGLLFYGLTWLYRKTETIQAKKLKAGPYAIFVISILILLAIGSRGGVQLRPLSLIGASKYAHAKAVPLVLNTPFSILKSSYKEDIKIRQYLPEEKLESIYSPVHHFAEDSLPKKLNVVLIIAESFSKEYTGLSQGKSYTPNLDSLMKASLVMENAYANGKKSIEALPAILSGLPSLMNTPYISSKYGSNPIGSIAKSLKENNYQSSFYHGGENGTMGFNSFCTMAGIDRYIGRDEYPNPDDYDGNWGIYDEPFLQFCLEDFKLMGEPFFASIFTLSSHHPYKIPEAYQGQFQGGELPILISIEYADFALGKFFEAAKKEAWFSHTLFVITADHTAQNLSPAAGSRVGIYEVPLIFYCPKYISPGSDQRITQQNDIYPSIIDFLGFEKSLIAYGNSVFEKDSNSFAVNYINETYQLIKGDFALHFDGEQSIGMFQLSSDSLLQNDVSQQFPKKKTEMEELLKAIIQDYNHRMVQNKMQPGLDKKK